jgi:allantoinase
LLVDAALRQECAISHEQITHLTNHNVAERFALADKGGIALGKDADLTLVDLNKEDLLTAAALHYRHRQSPYLGRKLRCRVVRTILRGQTIYRDGKLPAQPIGKLLRPQK